MQLVNQPINSDGDEKSQILLNDKPVMDLTFFHVDPSQVALMDLKILVELSIEEKNQAAALIFSKANLPCDVKYPKMLGLIKISSRAFKALKEYFSFEFLYVDETPFLLMGKNLTQVRGFSSNSEELLWLLCAHPDDNFKAIDAIIRMQEDVDYKMILAQACLSKNAKKIKHILENHEISSRETTFAMASAMIRGQLDMFKVLMMNSKFNEEDISILTKEMRLNQFKDAETLFQLKLGYGVRSE